MKENNDYAKISTTALLCAKARSEHTKLPYTKLLYQTLIQEHQEMAHRPLMKQKIPQNDLKNKMPILEGRYLAINDELQNTPRHSILELAAGLSPRSLTLAHSRPYIETDLQDIIDIKKGLISKIDPTSKKYNMYPLNVLHKNELLKLRHQLPKSRPIAIVHEGLMMYLCAKEKEKLRDNIKAFLQQSPRKSYWITTDFSSRDFNEQSTIMQSVENTTKRSFKRFDSDDDVYYFLQKANLKAEVLSNNHLTERLTCLDKIGIDPREANEGLHRYRAWKISLA